MNDDILTGQWKQMKGSLKSWWGQFTDDDFDDIGGQKDKLIGWVQEKYGRTTNKQLKRLTLGLKNMVTKTVALSPISKPRLTISVKPSLARLARPPTQYEVAWKKRVPTFKRKLSTTLVRTSPLSCVNIRYNRCSSV